jgi:hypothetical protein
VSRYRILTLDGGGAWALIEVMTLIDLFGEETKGREVLRNFDMVAANSGGSIVLGGLVEDLKLKQLLDFFLSEDKRKSIFVRKTLHFPGLEKYEAAKKLDGLRAALPQCSDKALNEVAMDIPGASGKPVHLLIVGFDYDSNRGTFFRSAEATRKGWGVGASCSATLAECIHASSNAPIRYFDRPALQPSLKNNKRFWDGAISGANNPVLVAVSEALVLGADPKNLAALSLGTGGTFLPLAPDDANDPIPPIYQAIHTSGLTTDLEKLAGAILDDPPDVASFMAHVMSGGPPDGLDGYDTPVDSSVVRMNPMISPVLNEAKEFVLPAGMDEDAFVKLVKLDMDAVEQDEVDEIVHFARLWLDGSVANQPVRMASDLTPEIGQRWHDAAKLAWQRLIA